MPTNDQKTFFTKKLVISSGAAILVAGIILFKLFGSADPPIEVGDGSIKFHYDGGIKKNSANEIEADKFLHKVKSISIGDYNKASSAPIDVTGRQWTLTSNSTSQFQLSLRSHSLGFEDGVPANCPSGWSGADADYTCTMGGSKLTPVTVTFSDGNCPGTSSPSCTLTCPSGSCQIQLEYK